MARGEGVKKLGDLFSVYKERLIAPQGAVIDMFIEVVQELLSVEIKKEKVSYNPHSKTLSLAIGGPLKAEILLRKEEVLAHMKARLSGKSAPKEIL
ncbi:hypothetical protein KTR10_00905 [Candidatus Kaiserbacteria bacterium]|nr:hypothetical protein [Candidatus Kaiserbacteria bacterium]